MGLESSVRFKNSGVLGVWSLSMWVSGSQVGFDVWCLCLEGYLVGFRLLTLCVGV